MSDDRQTINVHIVGGTVWIGLMLFIIACNTCATRSWTEHVAKALDQQNSRPSK